MDTSDVVSSAYSSMNTKLIQKLWTCLLYTSPLYSKNTVTIEKNTKCNYKSAVYKVEHSIIGESVKHLKRASHKFVLKMKKSVL